MLEIEIDGKVIQVNDGSTVMDAATQAGSYVPHFCYHKKLSIAANCRMCLVQVEKAPKPLPACATPVTNGMKVWTHSEAAVKAQKGVMEFLLINHPLDCPICDQGGECQLQDLAVGYGDSSSRYQEEKRVVLNKNLGSLVATDMTRCINCTRCVRFTQEIAGEMELGQAFRGEHAEIMPFVEKTVDSELSGNIIDLCPVGALTSKPFRFSARTWEMSRRKSVSPHDSLGSNLIVQVKHDTVKRVLPLENEAINECWLSDKDRFAYEALGSDERLTKPMIRQGGEWQEVDWQTALEFVANGLKSTVREQGAQSVGALLSPHATLEELHLAQKLMRGLGSENIDSRLRQADFSGDASRSGAPWLGMPIAEVASLNRLLVVGSFLRKDHPLLAQRVRQAAKRGLRVSYVGPNAEDWLLPVRNRALVAPGKMLAELAGVVKALSLAVSKPVSGAIADYVAAVAISPAAQAIADDLAAGSSAAVWLGNLAAQHPQAASLQQLAQEIARLVDGRVGIIGEAANSVGAHVVGAVPGAGGRNVADMLDKPLAAYLVLGAEAEFDFADAVKTRTAFEQAGLVVSLGAFRSVAALDYADAMLPIAPFTETAGTFVNCEGRVQSFYGVVKPLGETRPGWKVLRVLGNLLGLDGFDFAKADEVCVEALGGSPEFVSERLGGLVDVPLSSQPAAEGKGFERVADIPLYFADPLVRRAPSLQKTKDAAAPLARMNAATAAASGVADGQLVRLRSAAGVVSLTARVDEAVADGCVRVAGAHQSTAGLGPLSGVISVEGL
ncbi:NADH-quinone oxidoreductase subunit NuoG [Cognatazoarcus halotolerans]|uniref:NADH-quinone oxidoreductase subunit NuoG n=1 Tax=Cognatazoarcus halotolerans TaxID=2686016 RepID=UPI0013582D09|nr:NADH-quinone oxidoreductase subunit NuoG [Cognatazoarcus halotolerans]MCB1898808.1 NADH-quinone oxidoreductase subunit G [Rhodocyclaceae bacterium]MCP5309536.1 NADH-quinone oxidoreductase subunit G [Zoogloeaceae bacterium]